MNDTIINSDSSKQAKAHYENSNEWKNFSSRICKNKFVRSYLYEKYQHTCQYCHRQLNEDTFHLHHMTYMHTCRTPDTIEVSHPTEKRPNRTRKHPDCQSCMQQHPDEFSECMSLIVPVCNVCNTIISYKAGEIEYDKLSDTMKRIIKYSRH